MNPMLTNARRPASFPPPRRARPGAVRTRAALALALAAALAGCSRESRNLLSEEGSHRTPGAEARYPDVFVPKPKDAPPTTLSKAEQEAARAQLKETAARHKAEAESQIGQ